MTTPMAAFAGNREMVGLDYDEHHLKCSPTLRFSVGARCYVPDAAEDARHLIAAVDSALAARAEDGLDVEALEASFVYASPYNHFHDSFFSRGYMARHDHAADITSAHLARWLHFAAHRVTGSFVLSLPTVPPPKTTGTKMGLRMMHLELLDDQDGGGDGVVKRCDAAAVQEIRELYAELPASSRTKTVSLTLGDAEITVPVASAGAFGSLTDLFLSHCIIEPGEDANLGRMLSSSCCPRLRRLRLEHVAGVRALRLEAAGTLEELLLDRLKDVSILELDAPGLRSLHLLNCTKISEVSVSSPALETLGCDLPPDRTRLDSAASVRRLEKLYLWSHGFPREGHHDYRNAGAAWLLERCVALQSLDVIILAPIPPVENAGRTAELIGLLPQLPAVTDLSIESWVTPCVGPGHRLGHSAARLVAQCVSLRRLSVAFFNQYYETCEDPDGFCSPPAPEMQVMEQLVEAKIVGFRPLPDQVSLVRLLMAKAPALERMTVQFELSSEDDGDVPLPCDRGHWDCAAAKDLNDQPTYEWTPAAAAAP